MTETYGNTYPLLSRRKRNAGERSNDALPYSSVSPKSGKQAARVCVGIATKDRSKLAAAVIARLSRQTLPPTYIIVSATRPEDVADLTARSDLGIILGQPGLACQRNAILRKAPKDTEFIVFFDDDYVAHSNWLAAAVEAFASDERIACVTGEVVADGIIGPGIPFEEACAIADESADCADAVRVEGYSPYGCNMAFRLSAIAGESFDERLVSYGWLEDRDFGGVLLRKGWRLVKVGAARGVHMGVKQGRAPGRKLGYSQVINPIYMLRKGTISWACAAEIVARNVGSNVLRSFRPERYVDRRGRLHGNALAVFDLCRGYVAPERAESA